MPFCCSRRRRRCFLSLFAVFFCNIYITSHSRILSRFFCRIPIFDYIFVISFSLSQWNTLITRQNNKSNQEDCATKKNNKLRYFEAVINEEDEVFSHYLNRTSGLQVELRCVFLSLFCCCTIKRSAIWNVESSSRHAFVRSGVNVNRPSGRI